MFFTNVSESNLGRRYERLLMVSAPLAVAEILVLLVSYAGTNAIDRVRGSCLSKYATALEANLDKLESAWDPKRAEPGHWSYGLEQFLVHQQIRKIVREVPMSIGEIDCLSVENEITIPEVREKPAVLVERLKVEASKLLKTPLAVGKVTLPDKASVSFIGMKFEVEVTDLARILQLVLGPVILLWLGSLSATRNAETQKIAVTEQFEKVFPHYVNGYPTGNMLIIKRKSRYLPRPESWIFFFYAIARVVGFVLITAVPVGGYLASVAIDFPRSSWLFYVVPMFVTISYFMNWAIEFMPWHYTKHFPSKFDRDDPRSHNLM
ncbi:hypothetical protein [Tahibacter caeni]|uniref:hypothetical protein n=1 Tax=Tahibacter caeni TaxID=1453545 RepID=UPI002148F5CE|nr:hypothetical protein [Tahibacter caeni]